MMYQVELSILTTLTLTTEKTKTNGSRWQGWECDRGDYCITTRCSVPGPKNNTNKIRKEDRSIDVMTDCRGSKQKTELLFPLLLWQSSFFLLRALSSGRNRVLGWLTLLVLTSLGVSRRGRAKVLQERRPSRATRSLSCCGRGVARPGIWGACKRLGSETSNMKELEY
jgi:hypothetical protein